MRKSEAQNLLLKDHRMQIEKLYTGPLTQNDLNYIYNKDRSVWIGPQDRKPMSFEQKVWTYTLLSVIGVSVLTMIFGSRCNRSCFYELFLFSSLFAIYIFDKFEWSESENRQILFGSIVLSIFGVILDIVRIVVTS